MHPLPVALLLGLATSMASASNATCESEALGAAKRLLTLHAGDEAGNPKSYDAARRVAPLKNPLKPSQLFRVLEVKGHVSPRGEYRMRFIFAPEEIGCVLLGQEILEMTRL